MSDLLIDVEVLLDQAERELIVDGKAEFEFPVRRRPGVESFYERLEAELRTQTLFSVSDYRSVKEGYARVSRPARLRLTAEALYSRRPHLRALAREVDSWRREFTALGVESALRSSYRDMTGDSALTRACFEVLKYLLDNTDVIKGLLPRQVQHSESTKLIGRESLLLRLFGAWRGEAATWPQFFRYFELLERPVEFRFYAPVCSYMGIRLTDFHSVLSQDLADRYSFTGLSGTLIVENLETFHVEAVSSRDRLVIWGGGWKAVLLRSLERIFPRPILYWGDIDKEGYEIFGQLKAYVTDIRPTLMDRSTIESHLGYAIQKEAFFGPFRCAYELQAEYQDTCQRGICIEQEKIHLRPY